MIRISSTPIVIAILHRQWVRLLALVAIYGAVLSICLWLAYEVRFDFDVPDRFEQNLRAISCLVLAVQFGFLMYFNQFAGLLSYFSTPDLKRMFFACTGAAGILALVHAIWGLEFAPPRGVRSEEHTSELQSR